MQRLLAPWLASTLVLGSWGSLEAQDFVDDLEYPLNITQIRTAGAPVIPLFEGWFPNPDGTITLSFAYFNLNSEQALDIPLGPDNFIEPRQFDGGQPTHFNAAAQCCNRRHPSAFTVTVPGDYRGDVVWTLRSGGRTTSVPGRAVSEAYHVDNLEAFTAAPIAPELRFDPGGPVGRGRSGIVAGSLRSAAGDPLLLRLWVNPQPASATRTTRAYQVYNATGDQMAPRTRSTVLWYLHQGPGRVSFSDPRSVLEGGSGEVTTTATFSEPGEYVLRVWAIEDFGGVDQSCCWTTGYVRVAVTP